MTARTIVAATALISIAACAQQRQTPPTVVALADATSSVGTPTIRARYLNDLQTLIEWTGQHGGRLFGDTIEGNGLATSTVPLDVDFARSASTPNNPLYADADLQAKRQTAIKEAKALTSAPPADATDIVGGVVSAAGLFASRPDSAGLKVLAILSDMVQATAGPPGNFYSDDLSASAINSKIEQLKRLGLVPNLRRVIVYVVGLGADNTSQLPPQRILAIQNFWRTYFTASGATIPPGSFTPRMIGLPS